MAPDALDLGKVLELVLELVAVLELLFLARTHQTELLGRLRLPQADVHLVTRRHDVLVVKRPFDVHDVLHALGVVDLARSPALHREYANGLVVAGAGELLAGGRVVDAHHGRRVVHVRLERSVQLAHVERVQVVVLVGYREQHGLERIPCHRVRAHLEHHLAHRHRLSDVVQNDRPVSGTTQQQRIYLRTKQHNNNKNK